MLSPGWPGLFSTLPLNSVIPVEIASCLRLGMVRALLLAAACDIALNCITPCVDSSYLLFWLRVRPIPWHTMEFFLSYPSNGGSTGVLGTAAAVVC